MPGAKKFAQFWGVLRSISVKGIEAESKRPVKLILMGDVEAALNYAGKLLGRSVTQESDLSVDDIEFYDLSTHSQPPPESDSVIPVIANSSLDDKAFAGWADRLLDRQPDRTLALARKFPGLRPAACSRLIKETALVNSEVAMMSALPGVLPWTAALLSVSSVSDIVILSKNQAMMLLRLAAAYRMPLDTCSRSPEMMPLLGNAFGWRAIARELIAVVPDGIGLAIKGAIAYAGTVALGKALQAYYQNGTPITSREVNRYYQNAMIGARKVVPEILQNLRRRKKVRVKS
ncbi:MAG: hypothetical protein M1330_00625 [Armatimonadetes bacterium]|nr:hypothetical protein [Armatimonadota bacterium]